MTSTRFRLALFGLTAAIAVTLSGCSGSSGTKASPIHGSQGFGSLPAPASHAQAGGAVTMANPPGTPPNYIYPNEPATENGSVVAPSLLFRPLYWPTVGATPKINPSLSLAALPVYSNGNKTVTISMKSTYKWSNGASVDANDLVFSIDLIAAAVKEDPGNWSFYIPGQFPDGVVSATASSKYTVVLTLSKGYNSSFFTDSLLTDLIPLPSTAWNRSTAGGPGVDYSKPANARAIFDFLNGQSKKQQTFASSSLWQVVDGPFRLKSFNPATGGYTLVPNAKYSGPNPAKISELSFESFTSSAAEFNQLRSGTLTVGDLDLTQLPEISTLSAVGYNVYGLPPAGALDPLFLNFQDTTDNFDKVIAQLYVRQALQHLINQPGLIKSKGVYNGAAAEQYTTVGANSPYAPSFGSKAPYPYDPKTATKLLTDHGWEVVPSGKTTCLRPGATATECGVGIPKGQDISFALISANSPSAVSAQDLAFVSAARALGVRIDVQSKTPSYMYQNYSNVSAPANKNKWGMGDVGQITLGGLYPTAATLFSQQAVLNVGTYNSAAATKLFDETVYGSNPRALSAESTFVGENLPSLFMPNADIVRVWKKSLSGTQDSFSSLTQSDYGDVYTPEFWYYTK